MNTEQRYQRWLIGLDMTPMDDTIVQWIKYLSDILTPEVIYFLHVERDFEEIHYLPDELNDVKALDEKVEEKMRETVFKHFPETANNIHIEAIEGKPFHTLLHWADVKKVDLFIAGSKREKESNGILPYKLSRKLHCSVLFIPEIDPQEINNILIPIDFSSHSKLAVQSALNLKQYLPNTEVKCLHIFRVPIGYYKTGKSFEEFAYIMQTNAEKEFRLFSKDLDSKIECLYRVQPPSTAHIVKNTAEKESANLVIVGSKGQTNSSILLLGSTTEKIIQVNDYCPTLVVKKEGENIGFFEALRKLR